MSINIKGGHSINMPNVTTLSGLTVTTPNIIKKAGYMSSVGETDSGTLIGYNTNRKIKLTQDLRLITNVERPIFQDSFSHSVINNSKYKATKTNQTIIISGGTLNLNADYSVTNGDFSLIQTFKNISLNEAASTYLNIKASFSNTLQTNSLIEFGLGLVSSTSSPTDGIFYRASAGTLNAVISYSGLETTQIGVYTPSSNVIYDFLISVNDGRAEYFINDVMVASLVPNKNSIIFTSSTITSTTFSGVTSISNALPLFIRNVNTGTVASPVKISVSQLDVLYGDYKTNKSWSSIMSTEGQNSINATDGTAASSSGTYTANIVNILAPNIGTLSNTTAGYATLGGQFQFVGTGNTEDDYVLFAYLNPVGTSAVPGKTLVITGVYIDTFNSGATINASTGTTLQWILGVGGTSPSLLEVDSVTAGTRAARRLGLGMQSFAAGSVVGTLSNRLSFEPNTPLIVETGTYCHIILKIPVGVNTASLIFRGIVTINGYFE